MSQNDYSQKAIIRFFSTGSYLTINSAIYAFIASILLGVFGFMGIENYTLTDAFYMAVITISTVGYTEVEPLSEGGKIFSSIYIILNIGIFAYILSVFSSYVIEGEFFEKLQQSRMEKKINELQKHVILCGYGRYGKEIAENFVQHAIPFLIIENAPEEIEIIKKNDPPLLFLGGDATQDEILEQAGIMRAKTLVCALGDDTDNVFTVLSARQLCSHINIISRAVNPRTSRKLKLAGANHVIMPEQIGGFYMATLVSKPGAVEFFSFITNQYEADIDFEEISYDVLPPEYQKKSILDLHIRKKTGANIIGYKKPNGLYVVNPTPDTIIVPDSSFIILGNKEQMEKVREQFRKNDN